MEINFNKINERLHNEFPFSRTNLIIRYENIGKDCYTVELIVDDKHAKRSISKDDVLCMSEEMAQLYWDQVLNNLITLFKGYRRNETI